MTDTETGGAPAPSGTDALPTIASPGIQPGQTPGGAADPGGQPAAGTPPPAATPSAPPAPTPAPVTPPKTLAGGAEPPDTRLVVQADFPDDWREKMAAGDAKKLERLKRFNSPVDVAKSYWEIESKVSSGQLKAPPPPLPDNATPEQVTAWRTEQGLPVDADSFVKDLALPQGVIPGEADKPLLASFAESATKAGWTQQQYNDAVGWYYGLQDQLIADQQAGDSDYLNESTRELMAKWGTGFKHNQTRVTQFLDAHFPKDMQDILLSARTSDGRIIGNIPGFNEAILALETYVNPMGALLPNQPGAGVAQGDARIAEIEKYMRAPEKSAEWKSYWHGEAGARMQEEYRNLISARETMRERQGAGR